MSRRISAATAVVAMLATSVLVAVSSPADAAPVCERTWDHDAGTASVTLTITGLSQPRKVNEVQGKEGGKLTAGARWQPPTDAGGFAITRYKVALFTKEGRKVDSDVVTAATRKYLFTLPQGRYYFKVKARNVDRWGPWSRKTDLVRPR